jgi:hypothetical protein
MPYKTNILIFLLVYFLTNILCVQHSNGGVSLIQTFMETNIVPGARFGFSVSGAGDVNGDGFDDVIVGNLYNGQGSIYFGAAGSTMDNLSDIDLEGTACFFSAAGDVNGDGFDDVIGGHDTHDSNTGRAYIYFGAPSSTMDKVAALILDGEATENYFGKSVSGAGDVNGDGFDDVIVGAEGYNSATGRAYIYFGAAAGTMDNVPDLTLDGEAIDNYFGTSVSGAGDVNGDGFDDVIVGAEGYNSETGCAYIYFGATGSTMDIIADLILEDKETAWHFGTSVSGAGDVNGDSFNDVIVGTDTGSRKDSRMYIYFGAANSTMDSIADVICDVTEYTNVISVSGAGDVNGDGFDDVMASRWHGGDFNFTIFIYFGASGNTMDNSPDVTLSTEEYQIYFGKSFSAASDVNGDGFDDVIVGAPSDNHSLGRAYIYFGAANHAMDNAADLTLDNALGINSLFGYSVSGAGDVNGDGFDDVIVGAYNYYSNHGRAYIYFGAVNNAMDNVADITLNSKHDYYYQFGYSVSGAGDVNGDGYDDVIVGFPIYWHIDGFSIYFGASNSTMDNMPDVTYSSSSYENAVLGSSVSGAGDVNGDGFDDVIISVFTEGGWGSGIFALIFFGAFGNSMDNNPDFILNYRDTYDDIRVSVSGAGDVNGDGFDDVIVGDCDYNFAGRAYIHFGASGSTMDNITDVTLVGEAAGNQFGKAVSGAGDVNGDGFDDVIVGDYGYNSNTGRAYIYFGAANSIMDNTADVILDGEGTGNNFGYSVSGAGDINGDSFDDVIVGADGYNTETGRTYIYFGATGSTMDTTADIILDGQGTGNKFGFSVSGAGDVNGDSFDDIIVGAYNYPLNGKAYLYAGKLTDTDGDGIPDYLETGDRDGDNIPDSEDLDPTGWIYLENNGYIIPGGTIQVTGPGAVNIIQDGSNGYYQWTVSVPGVYTMIYTPPTGYLMSTNCPNQTGPYDPNPAINPNVIGLGSKNGTTDYMTDWDCSNNPYYFTFDLQPGDPIVINNNIPLKQEPTGITLTSFYAEVSQNGILTQWTTETEPNNVGFNIFRCTEENGSYSKVNDSLIPTLGDATTGASYSYVDKPEQAGDYYYKLQSVSLDGSISFHGPIFVGLTSVQIKKYAVPDNYTLSQNYPNPFNPETTIEFGLPKPGFVEISIYDINGKLVRKLVSEQRAAGNHIVRWNANDELGNRITSGIYYYRMKVSDSTNGGFGFQQTNKMILMK